MQTRQVLAVDEARLREAVTLARARPLVERDRPRALGVSRQAARQRFAGRTADV